jgi:glycosyl transferase family 87
MAIHNSIRRIRVPNIALCTGLTRMLANPTLSLATVATLVIVSVAFALHGVANPLGTDYLATVTGAQLMASPGACLYCLGDQIRVQADLLHQPIGTPDAFFGPPAIALIARPFLYMSASSGFAIFLLLSLVAVVAACRMSWHLLDGFQTVRWSSVALIGASVISLPAAWNYWLGQWDALLLLPAFGGAVLIARGRPLAAGVLLSLLLMKPQTVWLLPLILVFAGQWRLLGGMAVGAALWVATSLLLVPAGQLALWPAYVLAQAPAVSASIGFPGLISLLSGSQIGFPVALVSASTACAAAFLARKRLRHSPLLALALGLVLSFVCAPHIFAYDLIIISVPLIILAMGNLEAALLCTLSLNAAYLVDHYGPFPGAPAETLALIFLGILLCQELARTQFSARSARRRAVVRRG